MLGVLTMNKGATSREEGLASNLPRLFRDGPVKGEPRSVQARCQGPKMPNMGYEPRTQR